MEDKMTGFYAGEIKAPDNKKIIFSNLKISDKPNEFVFGKSGAGMCFGAKRELTESLLKENNKSKPLCSK